MPLTWIVLPHPTLPPVLPATPAATLAYAALHPTCGIALLDLAPAMAPNAVLRLRASLAMYGFDRAHPGHLPILHIQLAAFDRVSLPAFLDAAFAAEAPITLATDAEAQKWPALALRALGVSEVAALPAFLPGGPMQPIRSDAKPSQRPSPTAPARRTVAIGAGVLAVTAGVGLLAYNAGIVSPAEPASAPAAAPIAPPPALSTASVPPPPDPAPSVAEARPLPAEQQLAAPSPPAVEPVAAPPQPPPKAEPAPPAAAPPPSAALLLKRGDEMLAQHDLASARKFYGLAYDAGDGTAAVSLGQTYDAGDPAKAEEWYAKARAKHDPRVDLMLRLAKAARTIAPAPAGR